MSGLDLDALRCEVEALQAERDTARVEAGRLRESLRVLTREHDALITRLRAAEARTAWQPIETAPMGERVLALMDGLTIIAARGMLGWYDDDDRRVSVTAWAPLPAAPEAP